MANKIVLMSTLIPISIIVVLILSIIILYYIKKKDFLKQLRQYPLFSKEDVKNTNIKIQYGKKTDKNLTQLRQKYDLEKIAGNGLEIEQILNLMRWTHMLTRRASHPSYPEKMNALTLLQLIETKGKKLNCYMYATILNEALLSMGFKSRKIHMKPMKKDPKESHVINTVYSKTLGKWILLDPDFCVYIQDEHGMILSLEEIREKLIKNEPFVVSKEQHYNIGGLWGVIVNTLKHRTYRWYISKNIFRFTTALRSAFDYDSKGKKRDYLELIPLGYNDEMDTKSIVNKKITTTNTTNSKLFWKD
ncbi:MAG: hypothetical protein FK730_12985 [Asgard group archaeon]|nr:hypothetical protein [Asgard group archaeon]